MKKALFVGINQYRDRQIANLNCCIQDASALFGLFRTYGFDARLLIDPGEARFKDEVSSMANDLKPGDSFLFYFAGHGFTRKAHGDQVLAFSDSLLDDFELDASGISFNYLNQKTSKPGVSRAFILDACRSAIRSGVRGGSAITRDLVPIGNLPPRYMDKGTSYFVLRSCMQGQYAHEITSSGRVGGSDRNGGLFTLALIDVLDEARRTGMRIAFDDGLRLALTQRMTYLAELHLPDQKSRQTPEGTLTGCNGIVILEGRNASGPIPPPDPIHQAAPASRAKPAPRPKPTLAPEPVSDVFEAVLPKRVIDLYKYLLFKCEASPLVKTMDSLGEVNEDDDAKWLVTDVPAFVQLMESMPDFCKTAKQHKAEDRRVELENWFSNNWNALEKTHDADALMVLSVIRNSIINKKTRRI